MVTEEEREEMWREYAPEPRMRCNLGIRRRLAPLVDNDRAQLELLNALLFSLPGSPIIYYGDEIGMGDNIWLRDRNGVRTPMQWSADENAGFSSRASRRAFRAGDRRQGIQLSDSECRESGKEPDIAAQLDAQHDREFASG